MFLFVFNATYCFHFLSFFFIPDTSSTSTTISRKRKALAQDQRCKELHSVNSEIASYTILKSGVGLSKNYQFLLSTFARKKINLMKRWTENSDMTSQATITFILSWDFSIFYQIFLSAQVKRCALTTYKHGIYELPHELPNDLKLRILGNSKISGKCLNFIEW